MERIFLDANVLFSAAYIEQSGLVRLWSFNDITILSSTYAVEEARRNLEINRPEALPRLDKLLRDVVIVDPGTAAEVDLKVKIEAKDRPILLAAIAGGADALLTGDERHFGRLYGSNVGGVLVTRPSDFFRRRK